MRAALRRRMIFSTPKNSIPLLPGFPLFHKKEELWNVRQAVAVF